MPTPRPLRRHLPSASAALVLGVLLAAASGLRADPQPGDVWREYRVALGADGFFRIGGQFGGAQNLDRNYPLAPYRMALDKPQAQSYALDLADAIRAELTVGYNQGHSGAPELHVSINNQPYQLLPRPASIPNSGYFFHIYPTVDIPLAHLQPTNNVYKFTNAKWLRDPANYDAGYDQSLLYEMILRVYYDPARKPHPTGAITAPAPGGVLDGSLGARPTLTATATGAARVDFIGNYEDFDRLGDTQIRRWHYRWKHVNRNLHLDLIDHIGSDTAAPFSVDWNMEWVPNQTAPLSLSAFLTAPDGIMTMLEPVTGVTFQRSDRWVELARPTLTPANFKSSSSKLRDRQARFLVNGFDGDLRCATTARLMYQFWPGGDNEDMGFVLNSTHHHGFFYPAETFPTEYLRIGENDLELDQGGEHGMEVLWPGVGVYIAYETRAAPSVTRQPVDVAILPGGSARFEARFAGTPAPTYVWESRPRNGTWTPIPGAVSTTLDLGVPELAADGTQYRILATNAAGSATSTTVTLRVSPILPSFQPVNGLIVAEAENFDVHNLNGETYGWMVLDDVKVPFSGAAYIWNYYHNTTVSTWGAAATVRYRFRVQDAGNYTTWLRVRNRKVSKNHTIIVGFDGVEHRSLYPDKTTTNWIWISAPARSLTAGEHHLDIMRRSDGLAIDKVVLTNDPAYTPAAVNLGFGPPESPRAVHQSGLTRILFPIVSTVVKAGDTLTLLGEGTGLAWTISGAVTATGTGPSLPITIPADVAEGSTLDITLTGDQGADTLSLPVVTPPRPFAETAGLLVVEAEEFFTSDRRSDASPWAVRTDTAGFAGTGYTAIADDSTTARTWSTGALLTYDARFTTPGAYTVWMRTLAGDADGNSAFFGLVTTDPGTHFDNQTSSGWTWKRATYTVTIASPGLHTLGLVNREDGYAVDRFLMTLDAAFDPATVDGGLGPAPSGRVGDSLAFTYATWSAGIAWPTGADTTPAGNADGDAWSNAWEMFLGTNPVLADATRLEPDLVQDAGRTFLHWNFAFEPGAVQTLHLWTSHDLATWTGPVQLHPPAPPLPAGVTVELLGTPADMLDVRLDITGTEPVFQRFELVTP